MDSPIRPISSISAYKIVRDNLLKLLQLAIINIINPTCTCNSLLSASTLYVNSRTENDTLLIRLKADFRVSRYFTS